MLNFHDPALVRFIQLDTLVPDPASSAAYDRYAYANNKQIIDVNTPWGFINSWSEQGDYLYWMSDKDLKNTLYNP